MSRRQERDAAAHVQALMIWASLAALALAYAARELVYVLAQPYDVGEHRRRRRADEPQDGDACA